MLHKIIYIWNIFLQKCWLLFCLWLEPHLKTQYLLKVKVNVEHLLKSSMHFTWTQQSESLINLPVDSRWYSPLVCVTECHCSYSYYYIPEKSTQFTSEFPTILIISLREINARGFLFSIFKKKKAKSLSFAHFVFF